MMSDRERWIVYPLLFFAILMGFKSRLPQSEDLQCRSIRCNEIVINAINGDRRVRIGSSRSQSGELQLYGATGQPVLVLSTDRTGRQGLLETLDDQRNLQAVLGAEPAGGYVRLFGQGDTPALFLGHDTRLKLFGLLALNDQDKPLVLSRDEQPVLWGLQLPAPRSQPSTDPGSSDASSTPESQGAVENQPSSEKTEGASPAATPPSSEDPEPDSSPTSGEKAGAESTQGSDSASGSEARPG